MFGCRSATVPPGDAVEMLCYVGNRGMGALEYEPGFGHWLIKFERGGTTGGVPRDEGAVEFAYSQLARNAGIAMAECRLWRVGRRRHFMTRRFDRTAVGSKTHTQTLGALAHWDFRYGGACSYEGALAVARRLGLAMADLEALFRRLVFNVLASNRDDHVKNISFMMDDAGRWSLAPAYDLTYVFEGEVGEMYRHQMTINGTVDGFTRADLLKPAARAGIAKARAVTIVEEVREAVAGWRLVADDVGVRDHRIDVVARKMRDVSEHFESSGSS